MELEPYQQRVVAEKAELDEKIERLETFMASARFEGLLPIDQSGIHAQHVSMRGYSAALAFRIARFA